MKDIAKNCFKDIATDNPVIVAVSGGSDSLALLMLANIWAQQNNVILQAITVDHGLRAEAAVEASFVSSLCTGLDIPHVTLAWEGLKPSFGIQEAARQSRYSLMDDYAREIGADIILTGHTLDDQAETVFMRIARESGVGDGRGFSGMARTTSLYGGTKVIRPLLGVSRQRLRQLLSDFSQPWIEDPSNLDESYERVRVRQYLSVNEKLSEQLLLLAKTCGRFRAIASKNCAELLRTHLTMLPGPVFELDLSTLSDLPDVSVLHPVIAQVIQISIALAGGLDHLIPRRRITSVFEPLMSEETARVTLGGAVIERTEKGLRFYRERRNLSPLLLEPGEAAIWDGRLHIHNETSSPIFVEAAHRKQIKEFETLLGKPYEVAPRQALWSTPVVHIQSKQGDIAPCLPLVEAVKLPIGLEIRLASPAIEHFCPDFDDALRDWIRSLDQYPAASLQP